MNEEVPYSDAMLPVRDIRSESVICEPYGRVEECIPGQFEVHIISLCGGAVFWICDFIRVVDESPDLASAMNPAGILS